MIFDTEHGPADFTQLRIFLQFLIDKAQLLKKGNLQPNVAPLARIPSNGGERNQWVVEQGLAACKEFDVPCGILVNKGNIEKRVREGFKYLVVAGAPGDMEEAVRIGRRAAGR